MYVISWVLSGHSSEGTNEGENYSEWSTNYLKLIEAHEGKLVHPKTGNTQFYCGSLKASKGIPFMV